jgi:hypothetical protein
VNCRFKAAALAKLALKTQAHLSNSKKKNNRSFSCLIEISLKLLLWGRRIQRLAEVCSLWFKTKRVAAIALRSDRK